MDFLLRCIVLTLAAAAAGYVAGSLLAAYRLSRGAGSGTPSQVADALLRTRLLPLWGACALAVFAAVGLFRFESRDDDEAIGWILRLASVLGAGVLSAALTHLAIQQWKTMQLWRVWRRSAEIITLPGVHIPAYRVDVGFPIVAVLGTLRPRLIVDGSVVDQCDAEELDAIVAHERGHLRRHDNIRRMLFAAVPAPWMPDDLHERWIEATEEAADDLAAGGHGDARLRLASALVRVSRLADNASRTQYAPAHLPAIALYRGEGLERRVKRLLDTPAHTAQAARAWHMALAAVVASAAFALQHKLHDVMEMLVATLP